MDDVLEIIPRGKAKELTEHINKVDPSRNIKFTYEEEENKSLPFLDTLVERKPDGSLTTKVYRKKTHTNQYLNFTSHHPTNQKLGVIRSLIDRKESIVSDPEEQEKEESMIDNALRMCNYPEWSLDLAKKQQKEKSEKEKQKKKENSERSKGLVVLPYVKGLSKRISRSLGKHNIQVAMKPAKTLRKILVHPKDKIEKTSNVGVVYEIPCVNCDKKYIGETGRRLDTRIKEHKSDTEKNKKGPYTRSTRKTSLTEQNTSAVTDHMNIHNHNINWEKVDVVSKETNRFARIVKEAIAIRRTPNNMNRDEGTHHLSWSYNSIIPLTTRPTKVARQRKCQTSF